MKVLQGNVRMKRCENRGLDLMSVPHGISSMLFNAKVLFNSQSQFSFEILSLLEDRINICWNLKANDKCWISKSFKRGFQRNFYLSQIHSLVF